MLTALVAEVAHYRPGHFYERELPTLLRLADRAFLTPNEKGRRNGRPGIQ